MSPEQTIERGRRRRRHPAIAVLAPLLFSAYTVDQLLTQVLIFGIVAMSLIFLASYGGMVSLAQTAIFGIAGFAFGNLTTIDTKGLNLGYSPWVGIIPAILIATAIGLVYGGLASRSTGIYFLMITLTYGVIANLTFAQIENISGFGGISGIVPPSIIGTSDAHPHRLYYLRWWSPRCSTCSSATSSARPSASPCRACATSPCA